jgi:hypothetical protein
MFRHALTNLWLNIMGLFHMTRLSLKGWRYPRINFVSRTAFAIPNENRRVENLLFNTLKYHTVLQVLLSRLKRSFVLQVGHNEEELRLNLFLLVKDLGQADLNTTGHHFQGTDGLYYFLWDGVQKRLVRDRRLSHSGFYMEDPCLSICLPLSAGVKREVRDLVKWWMLAPSESPISHDSVSTTPAVFTHVELPPETTLPERS